MRTSDLTRKRARSDKATKLVTQANPPIAHPAMREPASEDAPKFLDNSIRLVCGLKC